MLLVLLQGLVLSLQLSVVFFQLRSVLLSLLLRFVHASLDGFSTFQIIAFERNGLRYELVLIVVRTFYFDGKSRDERSHRHRLPSGLQHTLYLSHFSVISQQDGKFRRLRSLHYHRFAISCLDKALDRCRLGSNRRA